MSSWEEAAKRAGLGERASDLALLRALVADSEVKQFESDAFDQMLRELEATGGYPQLTERQRRWAREVAERVGIGCENLVSSGRAARGREVPTPAVLDPARLPKKPPGRP